MNIKIYYSDLAIGFNPNTGAALSRSQVFEIISKLIQFFGVDSGNINIDNSDITIIVFSRQNFRKKWFYQYHTDIIYFDTAEDLALAKLLLV